MLNLPMGLQGKIAMMEITSLLPLPFNHYTCTGRTCVAFLMEDEDDSFRESEMWDKYFQFSRSQPERNLAELVWHIAPCYRKYVLLLLGYTQCCFFDSLFPLLCND
jgi:hypothetical protein